MKRICEKCGHDQYMGAVNWLPCEGCEQGEPRQDGTVPEHVTLSVGGQECVPCQDPGILSWGLDSAAQLDKWIALIGLQQRGSGESDEDLRQRLIQALNPTQSEARHRPSCAHDLAHASVSFYSIPGGAGVLVECDACKEHVEPCPKDWLQTESGEPTPEWALAAIRALVPGQEGLGLLPMGSLSMDECPHPDSMRSSVGGIDCCSCCWKTNPVRAPEPETDMRVPCILEGLELGGAVHRLGTSVPVDGFGHPTPESAREMWNLGNFHELRLTLDNGRTYVTGSPDSGWSAQ